jgi:hypothetical protein
MSSVLRWWVHRNLSTVLPPRALGALLTAILLIAALGAVAPRPSGQSGPAWAAGPAVPPPSATPPVSGPPAPRPAPGRAVPEPQGVAPRPSPPRWPADPTGDFVGWAVMGGDGWILTSDNGTEVSTTASMIKVWIAADYLRRLDEAGREPSPARLAQLTQVIRDSDNEHAQEIFEEIGAHESIDRLIDICGLPYARTVPHRWSNTQLSPVDTVLMGACIADGRAAGPRWTPWLLDEMRQVRGVGDFGIRDALPAELRSAVAIKNGWVVRSAQDAWHVNCLAIGDGWVMGAMTRYPAELGYQHGAEICRSLAAEHLLPLIDTPDGARPDHLQSDLDFS